MILRCISPDNTKNNNHRRISLTWTDHCKCKLSKNIQFEENAYLFFSYLAAHLDGTLPMKSHVPLITWSFEITWQTETIISPLSQSLWPRNLLGLKGLLTIKSYNALITCLAKSKNEKSLNLHYQSVYSHQTWQDGNFLWRAPTHKVTCLFDYLILRDHVTN